MSDITRALYSVVNTNTYSAYLFDYLHLDNHPANHPENARQTKAKISLYLTQRLQVASIFKADKNTGNVSTG